MLYHFVRTRGLENFRQSSYSALFFLWYNNELSSIFLLISSLFVATAHEMRYISATLCHFSFISSISLLLRETMPTRSPRLRLPHHTMSANRKKMPATMKPNIFTLSFFITPHHTLLLIPAHNPPPRSFTPAPCNPNSLPFPVPPLLLTTLTHYLTTLTPYTSLLPPLLITTPTHYLTTLTPNTSLSLPCSSQLLPTTSQPSLPPLTYSRPCSSQLYTHPLQPSISTTSLLPPLLLATPPLLLATPPHYLTTPTPYILQLPPLLITTLTHYLTTLTPYTLLLSTLLRSPNSLHFTALTPDTSQPRPTTLQLSLPPLYCSYPCSLQPRPLPCSFTPTPYSLHS